MSTNLGQTPPQPLGARSELAEKLLARLDQLAPRLGEVSVAMEILHLKRELARGHTVLATSHEDNNFLSVVTLVEAALASLTWKEYSPEILDALRRAFSAGLLEGEFTFEQYDAIRRHFKASRIPTAPSIDLTAASEGEDGQEAQPQHLPA